MARRPNPHVTVAPTAPLILHRCCRRCRHPTPTLSATHLCAGCRDLLLDAA